MPNLNSLLKQEIVRLARREIRSQVAPLQKASAGYRREIAAIKRQLAETQRQNRALERSNAKVAAARPLEASGKPVRFVAKGVRSMRQRLGLSAADLAKLLGVSEQSVYNWETQKSVPRLGQVHALAALRGIGKKEAKSRLEKLG